MFNTTARTVATAAIAVGFGAIVMASSAWALAISHDGTGTGGIVATAGGTVPVGLLDLRNEQPGSDLTALCDGIPVDACLLKRWSGNATHSMTVVPDGATTVIGEFVFNFSDLSWTDYHLELVGAGMETIGFGFIPIQEDGTAGDFSAAGITFLASGNALSLFFDMPFNSATGGPGVVALGILFAANSDGTFVVNQSPSFAIPEPGALLLFAAGLLGAGLARRRRAG